MIARVLELDQLVVTYMTSRGIVKQYEKAKRHILAGHVRLVDLKKRKPKQEGVYQFRITDKYRALCHRTGATLIVFDIDDHQ